MICPVLAGLLLLLQVLLYRKSLGWLPDHIAVVDMGAGGVIRIYNIHFQIRLGPGICVRVVFVWFAESQIW